MTVRIEQVDRATERDLVEVTAFVARDGDRSIVLAIVDVRVGFGNEHVAWLPDLYVLEGERRRGTGRRLLDAATASAAG